MRDAVAIARKNFKSDTECFVARSDKNDVVVAFRGSETAFFDQEGAFRDWVLTDFRANRIAYPPAPKSWPDQRWVHAGFWQAYNLVRNELLAEVTRKVKKKPGHVSDLCHRLLARRCPGIARGAGHRRSPAR